MPALRTAILLLCGLLPAPAACGWGDEGHEIVALIALHYLRAPVRARVQALLAGDHSALTPDPSIASEAIWADRYRDSDRDSSRVRYEHTFRWHFVDLELDAPDLRQACYGFPALPAGTPASQGPARDCIVDKIDEFAAELADAHTSPAERLQALQFLLHFVGDVHQPLHAADDRDRGGNRVRVSEPGERAGSLHGYWDVQFVRALGADPRAVAASLVGHISAAEQHAWAGGDARQWALQSFALARRVAYGALPAPDAHGHYQLSPAYVTRASQVVALQLSRAGVRLAMLLNRSLAPPTSGVSATGAASPAAADR